MLIESKENFLFSLRHPRVRVCIAVLIVMVLMGATITVAYWWPMVRTANSLQADIDERRREISRAEYNAGLAQAVGDAERQITLIEQKLDSSFTQAILMQNIAALARLNNVIIVSEAYEEGKAKDGYSSLVHELSVQAGYAELRGFIVGIQQLPTFTIVQEAVLSRPSNSLIIKAQLSVITYRRAVGPQT